MGPKTGFESEKSKFAMALAVESACNWPPPPSRRSKLMVVPEGTVWTGLMALLKWECLCARVTWNSCISLGDTERRRSDEVVTLKLAIVMYVGGALLLSSIAFFLPTWKDKVGLKLSNMNRLLVNDDQEFLCLHAPLFIVIYHTLHSTILELCKDCCSNSQLEYCWGHIRDSTITTTATTITASNTRFSETLCSISISFVRLYTWAIDHKVYGC